MRKFNATKTTQDLIVWIKNFFEENAKTNSKAIVAISGGKDSSVVAALCVAALGVENVFGVLLPNGVQTDIDYSKQLVDFLGIENVTVNIKDTVDALTLAIVERGGIVETAQMKTNLPARIRMTTLYAIAASIGGRVANTCNLSEDYVGYATKFGDAAGDFSPLSNLTVQEVKAVGRELKLPETLIEKVPTDGLCGKTDEDNLGFTYATLDTYIRTGVCKDAAVKAKIDSMHNNNLHKLLPMPSFMPI